MAYIGDSDVPLPDATINTLASAERTKIYDDVSSLADTYLAARYGSASVPLSAPGGALKAELGRIARYRILQHIGFNPEDGSHIDVQDANVDAMRWLERLAAGKVTLPLIETGQKDASTPSASSDDLRGF